MRRLSRPLALAVLAVIGAASRAPAVAPPDRVRSADEWLADSPPGARELSAVRVAIDAGNSA